MQRVKEEKESMLAGIVGLQMILDKPGNGFLLPYNRDSVIIMGNNRMGTQNDRIPKT